MNANKKYYKTLTIAGFDGSGGAGIQADLKTFSALGCYGLSVLTALPVQNSKGVQSIYRIPDICLTQQLNAVLEDMEVDAIKIGMLHRPEIIKIVAKALIRYPKIKVVLDPVMLSKNGTLLLSPESIETMKEELFPLADLITPNLPEASMVLHRKIYTKAHMEQAGLDLIQMGIRAVIIKGGHLSHQSCDDCLCISDLFHQVYWFSSPRIETKNTHGTGCTFSSAVAAYLAKGFPLINAVDNAKKYLFHCIKEGAEYNFGQGYGPVHHFFSQWA